jgi:carboxylate-amine ligase
MSSSGVDTRDDTSEKAVAALSHRFGSGPEYTLGVEEELMLIDDQTGMLAPDAPPIVAELGGDGHVKHELMQCQVEIATAPCTSAAEALSQLLDLRAAVAHGAALRGLRIVGAGTHPSSLAEEQPITNESRYRELVAALRYPVRRELCFGMHVHVAVGSADKAIALCEAMVSELPVLLALSASSPFWRGEESGLQSTRTVIFQSLPRSGLPPVFADYRDFAETLERLRAANAVRDHSYLWWDVRPHPRFGTLEVRIMDTQPSVEDAAALAGCVQALVRRAGRAYDRGTRYAPVNRLIACENRWLAARHGLRAMLVDSDSESGPVQAREAARHLLGRIAEDAAWLDSEWALERVAQIIEHGTSADRQLRAYRARHELADVIEVLAAESAPASA